MKLRYPLTLRSRPSVSVVIPCYNYGRFLPAAVSAALNQRGVEVEVIVVDDASTDDSLRIARNLAGRHPEVTVVSHPQNLGHLATFDDGLSRATGSYVTLVSADDMIASDALTRAATLMEANPMVGLVYGPVRQFRQTPPRQRATLETWTTWDGHDWLDAVCRLGMNRIWSPEAVMRTSLMRELGPYDRALPHSGDFLVWLRSAARMGVGRINGPAQAYYRVHETNMHLTIHEGAAVDLLQRHTAFELFFQRDGHLLPDPQGMLNRADGALFREALQEFRAARAAGRPVDELVSAARQISPEQAQALQRNPDPSGPEWVTRSYASLSYLAWRVGRLPWELPT